MVAEKKLGALDWARLIAAFLVVAIHISPLEDVSAEADFFLTKILARLAVPLFLMISGYFILSDGTANKIRFAFLKRIALLYGLSILLYLPIGIYAGHYDGLSAAGLLKMLLFDGTFYHLWYFPALILGALIVILLEKLPRKGWSLAAVIALYLLGLLGDGYWGLTEKIPYLSNAYEGYFEISSYTRCGLFYAPLFLWMGARLPKRKSVNKTVSIIGLASAFVLMSAEGFLLRALGWQRHTAMYLLLPVCAYFLFGLLREIPLPASKRARRISTWIYLLHPAVIVALRLGARLTGTTKILVDLLPLHFVAVCLLTFLLSYWIVKLPLPQRREPDACGRAWAELDFAALKHNVTLFRSILPSHCELMPAVKANAYGHGLIPFARALNELDVNAFCVASLEEGVELRQNGIRGEILVLGYTDPVDLPLVRRYRLIQSVVDLPYAKLLEAFGKPLRVHVALDTGMRRLGVRVDDMEGIEEIFQMKNLKIEGVFTHLCAGDSDNEFDVAFTEKQLRVFEDTVGALRQKGYGIPKVHAQASYGILNYPTFTGDYARLGIALYGVKSQEEDLDRMGLDLFPVLSLKAKIASVRALKAEEPAGYGLTFVAEKDMTIATLTIGYADGVPRSLSGGVGEVLIKGHRASIVGRICMDLLLVDVSHIPDVNTGDVATLIGRDGEEQITVYDWASKCNTLTNEILSRLGERPPRVIK